MGATDHNLTTGSLGGHDVHPSHGGLRCEVVISGTHQHISGSSPPRSPNRSTKIPILKPATHLPIGSSVSAARTGSVPIQDTPAELDQVQQGRIGCQNQRSRESGFGRWTRRDTTPMVRGVDRPNRRHDHVRWAWHRIRSARRDLCGGWATRPIPTASTALRRRLRARRHLALADTSLVTAGIRTRSRGRGAATGSGTVAVTVTDQTRSPTVAGFEAAAGSGADRRLRHGPRIVPDRARAGQRSDAGDTVELAARLLRWTPEEEEATKSAPS
jgi:hypothetical protein